MAHTDGSLDEQFESGLRMLQRAATSYKGRITSVESELDHTKSALAQAEGKVRSLEAELSDAKGTIQDLQGIIKNMKAELSKLYSFKKSIADSLEEDKVLSASLQDWEQPTNKYDSSNIKSPTLPRPTTSTTPISSLSTRSYSSNTSSFSSTPYSSTPSSTYSSTLHSGYPTSPTQPRKYSAVPSNETVDLIAQIDKRLSFEELSKPPHFSTNSNYTNLSNSNYSSTSTLPNGTSLSPNHISSSLGSSLSSSNLNYHTSNANLNSPSRGILNSTRDPSLSTSPRSSVSFELPSSSNKPIYNPPPSPTHLSSLSSSIPTSPTFRSRPSSPPRYLSTELNGTYVPSTTPLTPKHTKVPLAPFPSSDSSFSSVPPSPPLFKPRP